MDREIYDDSYVAKYDTETVLRLGTNLYREYAPFFSLKGLFVDIGCINDVIMDCAKKDGFETTGIDVAKRASKHTIINGNCEETIKTIKDASVIWFSHVLEHLQHPIVALQSVYNSIRSGGYLFLALPDPFFIDYADTMKWGHWHLREHHVFFEMTTLCKILQEIGFEIVTAKHNIEEKFICNYDMHIVARKN
jgi:predicted SAM-dependent methyltransferase